MTKTVLYPVIQGFLDIPEMRDIVSKQLIKNSNGRRIAVNITREVNSDPMWGFSVPREKLLSAATIDYLLGTSFDEATRQILNLRPTTEDYFADIGAEEGGVFYSSGLRGALEEATIDGQAIAQARDIAEQLKDLGGLSYTPLVFLHGNR